MEESQDIRRGKRTDYGEQMRLHCLSCNFSCTKKSVLTRHEVKHSKERPFDCHHCNHSAKTKDNLRCHLKTHENENVYVCDQCGVSLKTESILEEHLKLHEMKKDPNRYLLRCKFENCEFKTIHRQSLMSHVRKTHSEMKPYKCSQCDYACKYGSVLKSHVRHNHMDEEEREKFYMDCKFENCNYRSHNRSSLKRHMSIHYQNKTVECKTCKMTFKQKRHLKQHIDKKFCKRIEKKFVSCFPTCSYRSTSIRMLKIHLKNTHGSEYAVLEDGRITMKKVCHCHYSTLSKRMFKKHLRECHDKEDGIEKRLRRKNAVSTRGTLKPDPVFPASSSVISEPVVTSAVYSPGSIESLQSETPTIEVDSPSTPMTQELDNSPRSPSPVEIREYPKTSSPFNFIDKTKFSRSPRNSNSKISEFSFNFRDVSVDRDVSVGSGTPMPTSPNSWQDFDLDEYMDVALNVEISCERETPIIEEESEGDFQSEKSVNEIAQTNLLDRSSGISSGEDDFQSEKSVNEIAQTKSVDRSAGISRGEDDFQSEKSVKEIAQTNLLDRSAGISSGEDDFQSEKSVKEIAQTNLLDRSAGISSGEDDFQSEKSVNEIAQTNPLDLSAGISSGAGDFQSEKSVNEIAQTKSVDRSAGISSGEDDFQSEKSVNEIAQTKSVDRSAGISSVERDFQSQKFVNDIAQTNPLDLSVGISSCEGDFESQRSVNEIAPLDLSVRISSVEAVKGPLDLSLQKGLLVGGNLEDPIHFRRDKNVDYRSWLEQLDFSLRNVGAIFAEDCGSDVIDTDSNRSTNCTSTVKCDIFKVLNGDVQTQDCQRVPTYFLEDSFTRMVQK